MLLGVAQGAAQLFQAADAGVAGAGLVVARRLEADGLVAGRGGGRFQCGDGFRNVAAGVNQICLGRQFFQSHTQLGELSLGLG